MLEDGADLSAADSTAKAAAARTRTLASSWRVVSLLTLASRILGMIRDSCMAALFGGGPLLDAFTVAFRVPNLARGLFGEGALTAAFLPALVQRHEHEGPAAAHRLTVAVWLSVAILLGAVVLVAELAMLAWTSAAPVSNELRLLLELTGLMLPYVVIICVTALGCAALQAMHKFGIPAATSSIMNVVWLLVVLGVAPWIGTPLVQMRTICAGVLLAGVCQLAFVGTALARYGFVWQRPLPQDWVEIRRLARQILPVLAGLSITQLNTLVDSLIAWSFSAPEAHPQALMWDGGPAWPLHAGTASAMYLGQRLYQFPLGVFGASLGTVLFPLLSRHVQRGEWGLLREDLCLAIRLCLAIGIPAGVGLWLLSPAIARLFFRYGEFTAEDAQLTAHMIAGYGVGVWAMCLLLIVQRAYYAMGDRQTPLRSGVLAMSINLTLNLSLMWFIGSAGLAISTSVSSAVQAVYLVRRLKSGAGHLAWSDWGPALVKIASAAIVMGVVCVVCERIALQVEGPLQRLLAVLLPCLAGGGSYMAMCALLGYHEPFLLLGRKKH